MSDTEIYEKITFIGITSDDSVTFDNKEVKIILVDIFKCVVKVENCVWLEEIE